MKVSDLVQTLCQDAKPTYSKSGSGSENPATVFPTLKRLPGRDGHVLPVHGDNVVLAPGEVGPLYRLKSKVGK